MMKSSKKILAVGLAAMMLCSIVPVPTSAAPKASKAKMLSLSEKKITMEVGDELTIKSTGKKADIKAKITPKKAKKDIKVITNKKRVVRVKRLNKYTYRLIAENEGKAKITVISLSNQKLKKKLNITVNEPEDDDEEEEKEKNKPVVFSMTARQIAEDKISVVFTKEVPATVALSNFTLKDKTGNSNVALKNFTLGADKKSAEIQSLINFNIGSVYELSYNNPEDGKTYTAEINAKKGEVSSLKLLTTSVPVNVAKKLNFAVYDTEGVDVTASYKPYVTLTADVPAGKGFFDSTKNELKMFETGVTAKITMTYQEGIKKVEGTGMVSVTNQSTETANVVAWNLSQPANPLDWNKANNPAAHSLGLNTADLSIDVKVKTSDGREFKSDTDPANFNFKSSDAAIFTMAGKTIAPVAKGSADIIVEFTYEGKVSRFTPVKITIGENAKPQNIELSQGSLTVKKGATDDTTKIKFVRDQYGNIMNYGAGTWTFTTNPAAGAPSFSVVGDAVKADATGAGVVAGTYTIKAELTLGGEKTNVMFGTFVTP